MDTTYIKEKINLFADYLVDHIPSFLLSIFIFFIFYTIAEYYKSRIFTKKNSTMSKTSLEQEQFTYNNNLIYHQLSWLVYYSIIIFGLLVSLMNMGFNVGTIITIFGSIGFALALALQDSIKNIVSGIYIGVNNLFKIGDVISLKPLGYVNPTFGKVIDFTLYYTTILDNNNKISLIPNSVIQSNILTNITLSEIYNSNNQ